MTDNHFLVPQTRSESMLPKKLPCPFSAAGMLQPSHLQAPPMFGPRGQSKDLKSSLQFLVMNFSPSFRVNNPSEAFGAICTL